jgi:hypothetical protein
LELREALPASGDAVTVCFGNLDGNPDLDIAALVGAGAVSGATFDLVYRGVAIQPNLSAIVTLAAPAIPSNVYSASPSGVAAAGPLVFTMDASGLTELWTVNPYIGPSSPTPGPTGGAPSLGTFVQRLRFTR